MSTRKRKVAHLETYTGARGTSYRVYWQHDGKRQYSPRYRRRDDALTLAAAVERLSGALLASDPRVTSHSIIRDGLDAPARVAPATPAPVTLGHWLNVWVATHGRKPSTRRTYATQIRRLEPWRNLDVTRWSYGHDGTPATADIIADGLRTRYAERTCKETYARVESALHAARAAGVFTGPKPATPAWQIRRRGYALDECQAAALLGWLDATGRGRSRDYMALLLGSGMRAGELCNLHSTREQIRTHMQAVRVVEGKTGPRLIYLDDEAWRLVRTLAMRAGAGGRLFAKDPAAYRLALKAAVAAMPDVLPADLRLHDLRHTHGSWLLDTGTFSPVEIAKRMGHSVEQLTEIYGHPFGDAHQRMAASVGARMATPAGGLAAVR